MPRNKKLTDAEIRQIVALQSKNANQKDIAAALGRSRCLIQNFLKNPVQYGTKKAKGGQRKLSGKDERNIARICRSEKALGKR